MNTTSVMPSTDAAFKEETVYVIAGNDGSVQKIIVSDWIKNTGKAAAAEVPQVYVSKTGGKIARPDRELKGFEKIALAPGESKEVSILLTSGSFARYSTAGHDWVVDKGAYRVLVGSSSADIKLEFPMEL